MKCPSTSIKVFQQIISKKNEAIVSETESSAESFVLFSFFKEGNFIFFVLATTT